MRHRGIFAAHFGLTQRFIHVEPFWSSLIRTPAVSNAFFGAYTLPLCVQARRKVKQFGLRGQLNPSNRCCTFVLMITSTKSSIRLAYGCPHSGLDSRNLKTLSWRPRTSELC